ncbi:MAG: hypothetical protein IJV32_05320 [Bacteroidales bacterium]|nr:hypothetical protein [Bacteroidales bacterium]
MKTLKLCSVVLASLALAACGKNESAEADKAPGTVRVTLEASVPQSADDTKANVDNASGNFTWATGDAIAVYTSDGVFTKFVLADGYNGKANGVFHADLAEGVSIVVDNGVAVYPFSAAGGYDTATHEVTYNLPTSYSWNKDWKNRSYPAMYANVAGGDITFHHLGGIVRIPITDLATDGSLVRFFSEDKRITGAFTFDLDDTIPQITAQDMSGESTVDFTFTKPDKTGSSWVFNLPIPAGDYSKWTIKTYKKDGGFEGERYSKVSAKARTINPGDLVRMGSLSTVNVMNTFEDGSVPSNFSNEYSSISVVENPSSSSKNSSSYVLCNNNGGGSGMFMLTFTEGDYGSGFKNNVNYFRMSVKYSSADDAALYVPCIHVGGSGATKIKPSVVNGTTIATLNAESWAAAIDAEGWNTLEYASGDFSSKGEIHIRTLTDINGDATSTGTRIIYLDNFELLK